MMLQVEIAASMSYDGEGLETSGFDKNIKPPMEINEKAASNV